MVSHLHHPQGPGDEPAALAYDPSDPAFHTDPYPLYARLREEAPIHRSRSDAPAWVVTRYADCLALLRHPQVGCTLDLDPLAGVRGRGHLALVRRAREQQRVHRLLGEAVTPWTVQRLRPACEAMASCLLEAARAHEVLDLMPQLASPVAATLVCDLLDVPPGERARFREWLPELERALDAEPGSPERERSDAARSACAAYLAGRVAEDERAPRGGLLTRLSGRGGAEEPPGQPERITSIVQLALASYLLTRGLIGNLALALLRDREALRLVQADPGSVVHAVGECLRWDPPVQLAERVALADLDLHGRGVEAGEKLWLLVGAANRDPRSFRRPERFEALRAGPPQLGAGLGGPLGAGLELARMGAEVAISGLVRRIPRLVLAGDHLGGRSRSPFRAPERLPVAIAG